MREIRRRLQHLGGGRAGFACGTGRDRVELLDRGGLDRRRRVARCHRNVVLCCAVRISKASSATYKIGELRFANPPYELP